MNIEDIDRYSRQSAEAVRQIAKEEGWSDDQLKAAWEYTTPFRKFVSDYVKMVPPELMLCGFVLMREALRGVIAGTTQAMYEAERGELNEEDLT